MKFVNLEFVNIFNSECSFEIYEDRTVRFFSGGILKTQLTFSFNELEQEDIIFSLLSMGEVFLKSDIAKVKRNINSVFKEVKIYKRKFLLTSFDEDCISFSGYYTMDLYETIQIISCIFSKLLGGKAVRERDLIFLKIY